jgi:hypothetical protein
MKPLQSKKKRVSEGCSHTSTSSGLWSLPCRSAREPDRANNRISMSTWSPTFPRCQVYITMTVHDSSPKQVRDRPRRQGPKRQIRNHSLALPAALIENDLVHPGEDTLHGLEIESFARHLGCVLILLIDLVESGNLTGCLRDGLELVAFCLPTLVEYSRFRNRFGSVGTGISIPCFGGTLALLTTKTRQRDNANAANVSSASCSNQIGGDRRGVQR